MAGVASGASGESRPYDGISSGQEGGSTGEALTEWRSSEQLENGTPSTSPPFWDTEDDDDECGLRPSELYGKHTWKIDKFSQINKRELRSNAFEVGGYKWYILIYPQGCDVCNHLSLFLCVANHDKLLPGWSHFAQFTIAVVNKDPKKSKHSDTLHRFWKKEHDWGWKKFMELSKVLDGFIDADTLTIKAQIQVIREKADRPFRCLDCQYRRELVRVYLTNVEQICRKFLEEKRSKLGRLIEDKARWSSFCVFWLEIDQKSRCSMTRERTDSVLRVVVKQFFIEKEVTSTLVMDSLYSGLKALECQMKTKKDGHKLAGVDESPVPVVHIDQDMFVLVDDVLLLLERAALEPLPPKDDKGPQNRMKDGSSGDDFSKESIERDERRLTELGRRTIEIFVLTHIFSKIEAAYQEAVALKRQEELIREEAAWLESEQKSKRGAVEKEKKSKKKQGKQKRNNRKGKDKGRDDNAIANALDKLQLGSPDENKDSMAEESKPEVDNPETFEDVSDVSDTDDRVAEVLNPDSEEREYSPVNWDTDTSELLPPTEARGGGTSAPSAVQNGIRGSNGLFTVDDSSSTCSTDSVPSVITNGSYKANPLQYQESHRSPTRERNQRGRATCDMSGWANRVNIRSSDTRRHVGPQNGSSGSHKAESEPEAATDSLHDKMMKVEQYAVKGQIVSHQTEPSIKDQADTQRPSKEKAMVAPSSPISSSKNTPPSIQPNLEAKITAPTAKISVKRPLFDSPQLAPAVRNSVDVAASSRLESHKHLSPLKSTEKPFTQEGPVLSRPLSAPIVPGPRPNPPVVSMVQSQPLLSRSVSAVGRLDPDLTLVTHYHQSYRNAMMGTNIPAPPTSSGYTQAQSPNTAMNLLQPNPTPSKSTYPPMFPLQSSEFGMVNPPSIRNDVQALDLFNQVYSRSLDPVPIESPACTSGRRSHSALDEFPHLDIINDILDDEYETGNISKGRSTSFQNFNSVPPHLHRQFSYPGDVGMMNHMLGGPSTSFGRFERTRSYQENGFQSSYSSFGSPFESARDFFPQPNTRPFPNGQIDAMVPNQWQVPGSDLPLVPGSDLSYLSTRTSDGGGYPYHIQDYSNLAGNSNGYSVFHPNGQ